MSKELTEKWKKEVAAEILNPIFERIKEFRDIGTIVKLAQLEEQLKNELSDLDNGMVLYMGVYGKSMEEIQKAMKEKRLLIEKIHHLIELLK